MDPKDIVELVAVWLTLGLGGMFLLLPKFTSGLVGFGQVNSPFTGLRTFGGMLAALGGYAMYLDSSGAYIMLAVAWMGAGGANLFALMLEDDDATRMSLLRLLIALGVGSALYYVTAVA